MGKIKHFMKSRWSDLSYEGRSLRRVFRILQKRITDVLKKLENNPEDYEMLTNLLVSLCYASQRMARTAVKLVETADLEKRVADLEEIKKHIPPDVMQRVIQKMGT